MMHIRRYTSYSTIDILEKVCTLTRLLALYTVDSAWFLSVRGAPWRLSDQAKHCRDACCRPQRSKSLEAWRPLLNMHVTLPPRLLGLAHMSSPVLRLNSWRDCTNWIRFLCGGYDKSSIHLPRLSKLLWPYRSASCYKMMAWTSTICTQLSSNPNLSI